MHHLPSGRQINPEEFGEFENAYHSLTQTRKYSEDIQTAIENARKPVIFMEGDTDRKYLQRACKLFGKEKLIGQIDLREGGGSGNLRNAWKGFSGPLADIIPQKILLLFDCDSQVDQTNKGNLFRRTIPLQGDNPIEKGIENLFGKPILEKARRHKLAFINVVHEHKRTERGEERVVPEHWSVDEDEKTNLCGWICQNGSSKDFQHFQVMLDILGEFLDVKRSADPGLDED